jgi:hypothetical protein
LYQHRCPSNTVPASFCCRPSTASVAARLDSVMVVGHGLSFPRVPYPGFGRLGVAASHNMRVYF